MSSGIRTPEINIIVVGSVSVGKTTLINSYMNPPKDTFSGKTTPSINIGFHSKYIEIDNKIFKLNIWDTVGSDRDGLFLKNIIAKCHIVLFLWDLSKEDNFQSLADVSIWYHRTNNIVNHPKVMRAMAGSKLDKLSSLGLEEFKEYFIILDIYNSKMDPSYLLQKTKDFEVPGALSIVAPMNTTNLNERTNVISRVNAMAKTIFSKRDFPYCYLTTGKYPTYGTLELFHNLIKHYLELYPEILKSEAEPINSRVIISHETNQDLILADNSHTKIKIFDSCCT